MDIRIIKTKSSIKSAYITLLEKMPLEKISIRELCDTARINKTTFYKYYDNLQALSDALEKEAVADILTPYCSEHDFLDNPEEFLKNFPLTDDMTDDIYCLFRNRPNAFFDTIKEYLIGRYVRNNMTAEQKISLYFAICGIPASFIYLEDNSNISLQEARETIGSLTGLIIQNSSPRDSHLS